MSEVDGSRGGRTTARTSGMVLAVLGLTAAAACGPRGPGAEAPSPARELVVGARNGVLDPGRLACAIEGLPVWLEGELEELPALRRQRAARRAATIGKMAESMQRNMAAAELAYRAGTRNAALANEAIAAHHRGDHTGAAGTNALAMESSAAATRPEARVSAGTPRFARLTFSARGMTALGRVLDLSEEDASLLLPYARARAAQVTNPGAAEFDLLAAWDRDHPAVMEAFAELVLAAYHGDAAPCGDER